MEILHFTYDPLHLMRLVMDMHAERLEGKHTKAVQFARYEYLRTMTDEELKGNMQRYIDQEVLEAITLEKWDDDCRHLFGYIYESDRYKTLEFQFNKRGYGKTGLGVADTSDNTFYHCEFAHHWQTVMEIINTKYPHFGEALREMYFDDKIKEYNGVTRQELDHFILDRFELTGGNKRIDSYM
ncbi:hypothetical protein RKD55_004595 [Rossellomorea marisflavi]